MASRRFAGGGRARGSGAILALEALGAAALAAYLYSSGGIGAALAVLISAAPVMAAVLAFALRAMDPPLTPLLLALPLNLLGLATLAVIAPSFAVLQAAWSVAGCLSYFGLTLMPHIAGPARLATWLFAGALLLLGTTFLFGTHPSGGEARQWLPVGPVYFQPSEAVKLAIVPLLAVLLAPREPPPRLKGTWLIAPTLAILMLVAQGDLGAAAVVALITVTMYCSARGRLRWVAAIAVGALLVGALAWYAVPRAQLRLSSWLNPWADPYGVSYQVLQSLRAIASGGIVGRGLLTADPLYIPALHTDMILAGIGERLGLAGSLLIVALMLGLVRHIRSVARSVASPARRLACLGVATLIAGQAALIMAGTTALVPLTGVTLPFVSYGGSSLLVSYAALGLVSLNTRTTPREIDAPPLPVRQRAVYLGLAGALSIVAAWLLLWHLYGATILAQRLPPA